jgi:dihydrofolate synthase/folylpolyglutamate synthase
MQMDFDPKYQETLDYLYSYIDFSLVKTSRYSAERFELGRMRDFATSLGSPQNDYRVIHVAGTKGKGSVAALCASALQRSCLKVGLYTSPHLQDFTERIQVNSRPISPDELVALVEEIKPNIDASPEITTFEITTALAFLYFSRQDVDIAVLEVGLGGRLDATNVCTPDIAVITSISYDHTDLLGETLEEIAAEKAGILKQSIPLVLSPQAAEARKSILSIAAQQSVPVVEVGEDYLFRPLERSMCEQSLEIWTPDKGDGESDPIELSIPLLGEHQVENAATAYAALMVAREQGIQVSQDGIREGFRSVHWPGRFELLRKDPPLIIDSAHNRDSARKLHKVLQDYFPGEKVLLVFGASEDKDIRGMLSELKPAISEVVMTKSTHPRAADPDDLVNIAHELNLTAISKPSVEAAISEAEGLAKGSKILLIAGSIFVAAAARSVWMALESDKDRTAIGN